MGLLELTTDVCSWLDYKPAMADPLRPGRNARAELTSSLVPDEDLRRLAAYRLLAACDSNEAGQVAVSTGDDDAGTERRDLGDASRTSAEVLPLVVPAGWPRPRLAVMLLPRRRCGAVPWRWRVR